ncbi:MAG TPA: hypothetical protein VKC60_16380, partial [Opitutaceae bacterium]|nr:hypothetical protein [Opitutaceae bacterium]
GVYQKSDEFVPPTANDAIVTVDMSADGQHIVCGDYAASPGSLYVLLNQAGELVLQKQWSLPSGCCHSVRMSPTGASFAAGGPGCFYLFDVAPFIADGQPTITYPVENNGTVYGVAIADDASSFAGISNLNPASTAGGMVYFVDRVGTTGNLRWKYQTARNPNCASLNLSHGIIAISDGHPDGTPGDFYLLDAVTGLPRWKYVTGNMSWPIAISQDGSAIAAGSDDSNIYYFSSTGELFSVSR